MDPDARALRQPLRQPADGLPVGDVPPIARRAACDDRAAHERDSTAAGPRAHAAPLAGGEDGTVALRDRRLWLVAATTTTTRRAQAVVVRARVAQFPRPRKVAPQCDGRVRRVPAGAVGRRIAGVRLNATDGELDTAA